ncbi:ribonuclease VapC [Sphingomonas jinjuensis]|uniref:Ribonuclease VapC n=1 Tax=Sphingomonas jinjuensis TaxID=535907 RepID=A0A840FBS5_9SPHN|nr:type II toxin-antitoxin system VapC family toxin [Sphingomonas jinjuensis]MBB4152997.1 ribonuclease VapC [Sphingomonas jinjuensis]
MTTVVDASALVAIMRQESGAAQLEARLQSEPARFTTGIALWEASRAIARIINQAQLKAFDEVQRFCEALDILVLPIGAAEAAEAVRAQQLYGKGIHPARLNMGDCFAYACARTNGARLLYKGDDFAQTDMA